MLKNILITCAILAVSLSFVAFMLQRHSLDTSLNNWHNGFEGYIKAAREQQTSQKPVLLFFYTDWCANCEALRENVLATPAVDQFLENIIPVKINPEIGNLENQLANEFNIRGYPTLFLISPAQKIINIQGVSGITPEKFIQKCKTGMESLI